jgi:regulatory factor X
VRANSQSSRGSGAGGGDSDEDDEADSPEGPHSGNASKRSSLNLETFKHTGVPIALDDKTPTTSSQLAAAQNVAPSSTGLQQSAAIRRRTAQTPDPVFSGVHSGAGQPSGASNPNVNHVGAPGNTFNPPQQGQAQQPSSSQGPYSIRQLPSFPKIEEALGNASSSPQGMAAREVWRWFEDHLDALLDATRAFRFDQFELHLRTFWASLTGDHREVVHAPAVAGLMAKADALLYDVRDLRSSFRL